MAYGLYQSVDFWFVGRPELIAYPRVLNLGRSTKASFGTLHGMPAEPTATEGWSFRYPRRGGAGAIGMLNTPQALRLDPVMTVSSAIPCTVAWWEYQFTITGVSFGRFILDTDLSLAWLCWRRKDDGGLGPIRIGITGVNGVNIPTLPFLSVDGQWHHVMIVCREGPGSLNGASFSLYLDGVRHDGVSVASFGGGAAIARIGSWEAVGVAAEAAMDDIALWGSSALTDGEARAWYTASLLGHPQFFDAVRHPTARALSL